MTNFATEIKKCVKQTNKKMKKVRAAIVGYGNIGRYVLEALPSGSRF